MTEKAAVILVFLAMAVAVVIATVALRLLHADDQVLVFVCIVILCVGADTSSRVVIHYSDKSSAQRRRR